MSLEGPFKQTWARYEDMGHRWAFRPPKSELVVFSQGVPTSPSSDMVQGRRCRERSASSPDSQFQTQALPSANVSGRGRTGSRDGEQGFPTDSQSRVHQPKTPSKTGPPPDTGDEETSGFLVWHKGRAIHRSSPPMNLDPPVSDLTGKVDGRRRLSSSNKADRPSHDVFKGISLPVTWWSSTCGPMFGKK